jgi:uncharacterized protein involved in exopolysaccharide biosynthesis
VEDEREAEHRQMEADLRQLKADREADRARIKALEKALKDKDNQ